MSGFLVSTPSHLHCRVCGNTIATRHAPYCAIMYHHAPLIYPLNTHLSTFLHVFL